MKRGMLILVGAFGAVLALVVGLRLETAGLTMLVGVLCGLLAGLPLSAGLLWLVAREREARRQAEEQRWAHERPAVASPPVIVLNAGNPRGLESLPAAYPMLGEQAARNFVIVGEEEAPATAPAQGSGSAAEGHTTTAGMARWRSEP